MRVPGMLSFALADQNLQALMQLDALLAVDAETFAEKCWAETGPIEAMEVLLALLSTECGESAVASVLLQCGGAAWLLKFILSLKGLLSLKKL